MIKEELFRIIDSWSIDQLNVYIRDLEIRVIETEKLLKELRALRRRRSKKVNPDNGIRGG